MSLIINVDDFGLSSGVNQAVHELAALGAVSSTTVMVNMPYAVAARDLLDHKNFGVGLHFNLTHGCPIAASDQVRSLLNSEGQFYAQHEFRRRLSKGRISQEEIEVELCAQFERLESILGCAPDHIDSHQNIHKAWQVSRALLRFARSRAERIAVRAPARYTLLLEGDCVRARSHLLECLSVRQLRRLPSEVYLQGLTLALGKGFCAPVGELHAKSMKKLDLLEMLAGPAAPRLAMEAVLEIACHPATSLDGLDGCKLGDKRLQEYELMRSESFVASVQKMSLVTFRAC